MPSGVHGDVYGDVYGGVYGDPGFEEWQEVYDSVGYATAAMSNPGDLLTDFSDIIDLGTLPEDWWEHVNTNDPTKGRIAKADGTRLACDWLPGFDRALRRGWVRFRWSGSKPSMGELRVRVFPPREENSAVAPGDYYGQYRAYDEGWAEYWPMYDLDSRIEGGANLFTSGGTGLSAYEKVSGSRRFNGSRQLDRVGFSVPAGAPITYMAWFLATDETRSQVVAGYGDVSSPLWNWNSLRFRGNQTGKPVRLWTWLDDGVDDEQQTADFGHDEVDTFRWHHVAARVKPGDMVGYLDGQEGDSAPTLAPETVDRFRFGATAAQNNFDRLEGAISDGHVHFVDRSSAWIEFEHRQTADPVAHWSEWEWHGPDWLTRTIRSSLFSAGEKGVIFDLSDRTSVFKDMMMEEPVSQPGDLVSVVLDRSGGGRHAIQGDVTAQPEWHCRVNLLQHTDDFSNDYWPKGGSTWTFGHEDSQGGFTAAYAETPNTGIWARTFIAPSDDIEYSIDVKYGGVGSQNFTFLLRNDSTATNFDILTFATNTGVNASDTPGWTIKPLGNGWYRISYRRTEGITRGNQLRIYYGRGGASTLTAGVFLARPSVCEGRFGHLPYQRVSTPSDYDADPVFPGYLVFDGVDDYLTTFPVDWSDVSDFTAWARYETFNMLGDDLQFLVNMGSTAVPTLYLTAKHTHQAMGLHAGVSGGALTARKTGVNGPTEQFISGRFIADNGSEAELIHRWNAFHQVVSTGPQQSGTFFNEGFTIGRQSNNAIRFFGGKLYSLVLRSGATPIEMMEQVEQWMLRWRPMEPPRLAAIATGQTAALVDWEHSGADVTHFLLQRRRKP